MEITPMEQEFEKSNSCSIEIQISKPLPAPRLRQAGKCQMNIKVQTKVKV
jgi:hypothetical protein